MLSRHHRSHSRHFTRAEIQDVTFERDRDHLFLATVTAAAFVARADGWVDPAERDRVVDWVSETPLLDSFAASEVTETFDFKLRQFDQPGGMNDVVLALRRVAGRAEARLVVAGAEQVANADGAVMPAETAAIRLLRRTLFIR
jgi:tellurite resistance protein